MDNFVALKDVHFSHGQRTIYDGLSLTVPKGKIVAVMGPSGIGKTTLLRLIGGQLRPSSGSIKVADEEVTQLSRKALYELRKRMSMLFQSGALFTDLSVFENVAFPLRVHTELPEDMIRDIVLLKLQAVGLRGARDLMPDEFVGQDPISMGVLVRLIRLLNDALGLSSIVVSHDLAETASIADYLYVVGDGQVLGQGTPDELMNSDNPRIRQFMQGEPDGPVPFHFPARDYLQDLIQAEKDA